jgi:branched-chain amino acid transport system ATP-binding protein
MLEISDLSVHYDRIPALSGVTLRVEAGEIVALLGANGAGKSTLVNTASGLIAPKSGRITFDGVEIAGRPAETIARRGLIQVPEGRQLFPLLTIEENLRMGAYLVRDPQRVAESLDEVFGLFPVLKDRRRLTAQTLSGGQQQMLAIGRALMSRPRMMMLDEPSLGLAPLLVAQIFAVIQTLHRRGLPILLIEQNAALSLTVSHRAYVLEHGRIILSGPSRELLTNPQVEKAYLGI